jgi:hypothetical protein
MSGRSPEVAVDQLNQQLAVLEGARAELEAGSARGLCLVGALARAGSRQPGAAPGVGRAVDAVYHALCDVLRASRGRTGGLARVRVPPPEVRLARARALTQWHDRPGRTRAEVLAVVDRAISATVMDLTSESSGALFARRRAGRFI